MEGSLALIDPVADNHFARAVWGSTLTGGDDEGVGRPVSDLIAALHAPSGSVREAVAVASWNGSQKSLDQADQFFTFGHPR
jgi:hypothetical protein